MFWVTLWPLDPRLRASRAPSSPSPAATRCAASWATTGRRPSRGPRSSAWSRRRAPTRRRPWPSRSSSAARTTSPRMVFMFASTNLVIELGIVLIVLMGWQFAVSEFVGGVIMIGLLASLGALWLRGRLVVARPGPPGASGRCRRTRARAHAGRRARTDQARRRRLAHPGALAGQVGGQRHLHDGRPDDAAARAPHRLRRRRLPGRRWCRRRSGRPSSSPATGSGRASRTPSSARSSRSSASSAPSATCRWRQRCGTAASRSAA